MQAHMLSCFFLLVAKGTQGLQGQFRLRSLSAVSSLHC
jgi:hypothetical protein